MHKKKVTVILTIILIGVISIRIAGVKSLTFSLGLDSIYLRIVNIFEKDLNLPNDPVFNKVIDVSVPLDGWYIKPDRKEKGDFFNLFSGNINLTSKDFIVLPSGESHNSWNPLSFIRHYNSSSRDLSDIGYSWKTFLDYKFILIDDIYVLTTPSGTDISFRYQPRENKYQVIKNGWLKYSLKFNENSGSFYVYTSSDKILEFSQSESENIFYLTNIHHENGIQYKVSRNKQGKITQIEENGTERKTRYNYDQQNDLLKTVTFPSGEKLNLSYDKYLNLIKADISGFISYTYNYNDPAFIHLLTDVTHGADRIYIFNYKDGLINKVKSRGFSYNVINDSIFGSVKISHENNSDFRFVNVGEYQLRVEGPLGFNEKIIFDKKGRIVEVNDSQKRQSVFSWDKNNRLIQKENQRKGVEVLNYNESGKLISHVDSLGNSTELNYSEGLLQKVTFPDKTFEKYSYQGKLIAQITNHKGERIKSILYDQSANPVKITANKNNTIQYTYTADGYVNEKLSPGLWKEMYSWRAGKLLSVKYQEVGDAIKKHCTLTYNKSGEISTIRWSDGSKTSFNYDEYGNLINKLLPEGSQIKYQYVTGGLLKKIARSDGRNLEINYDMLMRPEMLELNGSKQWKFIYSKKNNIPVMPFSRKFSQVITPDGKKTELFYDIGYGVEKIIWPGQQQDEFNYDLNGNMISFKNNYSQDNLSLFYDPNGFLEYLYDKSKDSVHIFKHNTKGELLSFTNEKGKTYSIKRTSEGRPESIIEGVDKKLVSWDYDYYGNISSIKAGESWRKFYYDQHGNIAGIYDSAKGLMENSFSAAGLLEETVDQEGRNIEFLYHGNRLLKSKRYVSNDESFQWFYDLAGRPKRVTGDYPYKYEWNEDGSLAKLNFDKKNSLIYTYNLSNKIIKKTYPGYLNQENNYDETGRILSVSENGLDPVNYEYSEEGFLERIIYPNNVFTDYTYDVSNRISSIVTTDEDGEVIFKRAYQYDDNNNLIREETERGVILRRFNDKNQLVWEKGDTKDATEKTYFYHDNGKISEVNVKSDKREETLKYVYHSESGNLTKIYSPEHLPKDDDFRINIKGEVVDKGGFLEIDKQVVQVSQDNSFVVSNVLLRPGENDIQVNSVTPSGRKENFPYKLSYDPQALETRRIDSTGKIFFRSKNGTHVNYIYNDERLLQEVNYLVGGKIRQIKYGYYANQILAIRSDQILDSTKPDFSRYIFDEKGNIIGILQKEGSYKSLYIYTPEGDILYRIDRGQKKFYFHTDHLGSVIGITDQRGTAVASYSYDNFGRNFHIWEKEVNNFRYLGHFQDPDSGFYFCQGQTLLPEEHARQYLSNNSDSLISHPDKLINALLPEHYRKKINPFIPDLFINVIIPDEFKQSEEAVLKSHNEIKDSSFWISRFSSDMIFDDLENQENKLFFTR